jgi:protein-L-isoaspartate(D-aspartate) O-methyltransferase
LRSDDFEKQRARMVESQIRARGVKDERVLKALRSVPRHLFVPPDMVPYAHADEPLPVGEGQTISQPYIVAYMTEALSLVGTERVLEVGTGSGYQTAVLAELAAQVFTVEIIGSLSARAQDVLGRLGYSNIRFQVGDGSLGWPEEAPFDRIMVTAAATAMPLALRDQLAERGLMILPLGSINQELVLVERRKAEFPETRLLPVRFVPLISVH